MVKTKYKSVNKCDEEILKVEDDWEVNETTSLRERSEEVKIEPNISSPNTHHKSRSDFIKGIILIILVDLLWIIGSEIVQVFIYLFIIYYH